jgi:hypothetical protein
MRSDYLDTSNPLRLKAFFMFCDVANNARAYISALNIDDPLAGRICRGVMESMRQQSIQRAIDTLSGRSDFFALVESSLSEE